MKKILAVFLAAGVGFAVAYLMVSNRLVARHAEQLTEERAAWLAEKAALEAALEEAKAHPQIVNVPVPPASAPSAAAPASAQLSSAQIIAKLRALKASSASPTRVLRQTVHGLEELIAAGPAALPAIREFLARHDDIDFGSTNQGKGLRLDSLPTEFMLPPSLRFGLLDVVKQIGGSDAEKLLAETLASTGRGVELAWLARVLQEMAPGQYRDTALAAARELLLRPPAVNPSSPLDRNDRDNLFSVLTLYGDHSFVSSAQAQLLRADGQVDRSALRYLQESLGPQSVALVAQMYNDPRLADPGTKEPLARVALNFVGADAQANEFYQKAINDLALPNEHRKNLIEDLNRDGFPSTKNLTERDLPLIMNRISIIEQLAPSATDPVNAAAFQEAYKDLLKMRDRVLRPPVPVK